MSADRFELPIGERRMSGVWRRVLLVMLGWAGVTVFLSLFFAAQHVGDDTSIVFIFYSNAVHYALWALALPLVGVCVRRFPVHLGPRLRTRNVLAPVGMCLVCAPFLTAVYLAILFNTYFPHRQSFPTFTSLFGSYMKGLFEVDLLTAIMLVVGVQGWRVWQDLQAERLRAAGLEQQLSAARLDALRMQLHPHFLFNTLHTIAGMIGHEPATARRMVVALGEFLRMTLKDGVAPLWSLAEELEFVDLYMRVQKLRLGNRLIVDYRIDSEAMSAELPHLLLQPLFENAVPSWSVASGRTLRDHFPRQPTGRAAGASARKRCPARAIATSGAATRCRPVEYVVAAASALRTRFPVRPQRPAARWHANRPPAALSQGAFEIR